MLLKVDGTKLLSQKTLLTAKWFTVEESTVVYPDESKHVHHNVIRQPSASIFPVTPRYNIYLIRQYRYLLGRDTLEAVAGMVEKGESPLTCAKRELKEEAGIIAGQWELLMKVDGSGSTTFVPGNLFLARDLEVTRAKNDASEIIEVVKMPLTKAVEKIFTGEITTSSTIIGIMMLDKLRRERKI